MQHFHLTLVFRYKVFLFKKNIYTINNETINERRRVNNKKNCMLCANENQKIVNKLIEHNKQTNKKPSSCVYSFHIWVGLGGWLTRFCIPFTRAIRPSSWFSHYVQIAQTHVFPPQFSIRSWAISPFCVCVCVCCTTRLFSTRSPSLAVREINLLVACEHKSVRRLLPHEDCVSGCALKSHNSGWGVLL